MTNVNSHLKNLLAKHGKEFRKKELDQMKLTIEEIRRASNSKLRNLLKEDLPVEIDDMISKELFEVREAGRGEDIWN